MNKNSNSSGPTPAANATEVKHSNNALIEEAKSWVGKGDSSKAMECMISAIREKYGESKIMEVLEAAKKSHQADNRDILRKAVSGEGSILMEEYSDASACLRDSVKSGESRVCTRCGDVVATSRLDAHSQYWCSALPDVDSE
eukprot:TRINITY_DN13393_c1_g1_i1.p1 TRINITY_DN13393_c1_g1~~TRINITY_DN13393_c1_g1_i1.p1  ORF type:complete len:142 (+),score=25.59 TRINITY_DN13393_c1_g1_i1:130-555(+)